MKKIAAILIAGAIGASTIGLAQPAMASPKAGSSCSKVGAVTSKKPTGYLKCVKVSGQRTWLYLQTPKSKSQAQAILKKWTSALDLPDEDLIRRHAGTSPAYVQQRLAAAQQQRDTIAAQSNSAEAQVNALRNEIDGLPDRVASAQQAVADTEGRLAKPKADYQSALSLENLAYSEFAYWEDAKVAYIGCQILEDFGFGGSCGYFNDSAYSSARYQYNLAKSKTDAAKAAYDAAYKEYEAKYNIYKALYDRQQVAQGELASASANAQTLAANLEASEGHLAASHDANGYLQDVTFKLSQYETVLAKYNKVATTKLSGDWQKTFAAAALSRGVADALRRNIVQSFLAFRSLTPDLPDPQPETVQEPPVASDPPAAEPAEQ